MTESGRFDRAIQLLTLMAALIMPVVTYRWLQDEVRTSAMKAGSLLADEHDQLDEDGRTVFAMLQNTGPLPIDNVKLVVQPGRKPTEEDEKQVKIDASRSGPKSSSEAAPPKINITPNFMIVTVDRLQPGANLDVRLWHSRRNEGGRYDDVGVWVSSDASPPRPVLHAAQSDAAIYRPIGRAEPQGTVRHD